MNKFKIIIEGAHAFAPDSDLKEGDIIPLDITDGHSPYSLGLLLTDKLKHYDSEITSSVIIHTPDEGDQLVDDLDKGVRSGHIPA